MHPLQESSGSLFEIVHRNAATHARRAAIVDGEHEVSFGELSRLITAQAAAWRVPYRSLVLLSGDPCLNFVVAYLSLLDAGHVPLLAGRHVEELAAAWRPDAVVCATTAGIAWQNRSVSGHVLHPDLALLLSTSGSTGSPKLVRLSHRNLVSNARSITEYLSLGTEDRSLTALPLHYCYGLSVLHSHLVAGASVALSAASVLDPCFQDALRRHRVTNFAGVPHTFELLERSGFDATRFPHLRFLTQAGGRMEPDRVRGWAELLGRRGAELFVMYGQTEATARMAFLPPALATRCPQAIGVAVPGGSIELRPHPAAIDPDVGEVVYRGPNVMMGYAERLTDLARGHDLDELCTGDLGRLRPEGVYEIVGRTSRFVKPFGLRIDLDRVERELTRDGSAVAVAGDDQRLVVATVGGSVSSRREAVTTFTGLPAACVDVVLCDELPRTASGKVDAAAIMALPPVRTAFPMGAPDSVAALYAELLSRKGVNGNDTFVSLGGDSLSYVECGQRLEELLGPLPSDWHVRTVAELGSVVTAPPRWCPRLDTTVLLRAFSISAVVATHMRLYRFPGGAHLLLAVVGYNLARFQLAIVSTRARTMSMLRTVARVAVPTSLWIGVNMLITGGYSAGALVLINNYTGSPWRREGRWQYWFFEVFVQLLVLVSLLLAVPAVRRLERRTPFLFPLALLVPSLAFRFRWLEWGDHYNYLFRTHTVAWFFLLGWAIQQAERVWARVLMTALAIWTVPDFFGRGQRELFILAGLVLMLWAPSLPMPRVLHRPIGALASASMWIFLVHWQAWPPLDEHLPRAVAYVLTMATGVALWRLFLLRRTLLPWCARLGAALSPDRVRAVAAAGNPSTARHRPPATAGSTNRRRSRPRRPAMPGR